MKNFKEHLPAVYLAALKENGMPFVYFRGNQVTCPGCGATYDAHTEGHDAFTALLPGCVITLGTGFKCPSCTTYFKALPSEANKMANSSSSAGVGRTRLILGRDRDYFLVEANHLISGELAEVEKHAEAVEKNIRRVPVKSRKSR